MLRAAAYSLAVFCAGMGLGQAARHWSVAAAFWGLAVFVFLLARQMEN
jgi:hypothetical protein